MENITSHYKQGKTEVIDLHHLQHLKTPLDFTLKENLSPLLIRDALHPTPALGGLPKLEAQNFIRAHPY